MSSKQKYDVEKKEREAFVQEKEEKESEKPSLPISIFGIITLLFCIPILVVGVVYKDDCSTYKFIPIWLIVYGSFGTFGGLVRLVHKLYLYTSYSDDEKSVKNQLIAWFIIFFTLLVFIFLGAWTFRGLVWYSNVFDEIQTNSPDRPYYCHKVPFWFTFVITKVSFIFVVLPLIFFYIKRIIPLTINHCTSKIFSCCKKTSNNEEI